MDRQGTSKSRSGSRKVDRVARRLYARKNDAGSVYDVCGAWRHAPYANDDDAKAWGTSQRLRVIRASLVQWLRIRMRSCSYSYAASLAFLTHAPCRKRIKCCLARRARMAPDG